MTILSIEKVLVILTLHKHFIGELVQDKHIELTPCATDLMVAVALTKGFPTPAFLKHKVEMLGMGNKVY